MYHFRMVGIIKDSDAEELREVLFKNGRLSGDRTLVEELKERASVYESMGKAIAGYSPKGEDYIKDAKAVILLMREVCHHGQIWGMYPQLEKEN
ncbi:hypothetical protein CN481_16780 [Bacillus sp. AFS006103]|nr:hypothetical protein CN481_16780 [Bacillus sp. AFS006103]